MEWNLRISGAVLSDFGASDIGLDLRGRRGSMHDRLYTNYIYIYVYIYTYIYISIYTHSYTLGH